MSALIRAIAIIMFVTTAGAQTRYYVNDSCGDDAWTGLGIDCMPPDGPKRTISAAVHLAASGDEVIVAPGTYSLKTNSFTIKYDAITVRSSDGPFVTILDGAGGEGLIQCAYLDIEPGVIDGFTIRSVDTNYPAPLLVYEADIILSNCRFLDNHGFYAGGAWVEIGSSSTITAINCEFQGNSGSAVGGIGAWDAEVIGCTFVDNAGQGGGASVIGLEHLSATNSIFRGPGPHLAGKGVVAYSNIEGGFAGEGNIDADPLFASAPGGDLRLSAGSPCIDAANNFAVPGWIRTDIHGLPRFIDDPVTPDTGWGDAPIVDMGAHEFQALCYPDFTRDGALDIFDFLAYINAFNGGADSADCNADGIHDLFDFLCFVNSYNIGC